MSKVPYLAPNFITVGAMACGLGAMLLAHRGDYDLSKHAAATRDKLDYFDQEQNKRYIPHVIEPSAGADRGVLALLCEGYRYDESRASPEWLKLAPQLAPVKLGIFPLVNKDGMPEIAQRIYRDLKKQFNVFYDEKGAVGRRYRRQDEAGTPYCITIDSQTLEDGTVTIRYRDDKRQERIQVERVVEIVREALSAGAR